MQSQTASFFTVDLVCVLTVNLQQVSEALARGLPVVMSDFTKDSFGNGVPGCVGTDSSSYKKCITDLDENRETWEALRDEGISYIEHTHSRHEAMGRWSRIIDSNKRAHDLLSKTIPVPTEKCDEGEEVYLGAYKDIGIAIEEGIFESGFQHWDLHGKREGRCYYCNPKGSVHNLLLNTIPFPTKKCDEGEEIYLGAYDDIGIAIKEGQFESGFHHWDLHGKREGRSYYCNGVLQPNAQEKSAANEKSAAQDLARANGEKDLWCHSF